MLYAIIIGFTGSLVAPLIYKMTRNYAGGILALIPLCLCVYFISFLPVATQTGPLSFSRDWVPGLGVDLSFYVDGLSLLFAVIISFVGILVLAYAGPYFKGKTGIGRFYAYILFFMSAMLGLVLSDNIITLFVFWELTGVSSFLLIGFDHEMEGARKAAWQALLVTGMGGLALMAGLLVLGEAGGSYAISRLLTRAGMLQNNAAYPAIFLLIALGAFTKSAQFPFHFWLPDAMAAPTPVSTYLHSATMVKAGIYLLARMSPILGGTMLWHSVLVPVGAVTMIMSAALSIRQTDLKKILAYSTVSVLGTLVFLLGTGTHAAVEAAMAYVMIHALYKAALFLIAGIVDHETGTRDIGRLSGLGRAMPMTAGAAVLAGLSMAGLPPLFGFIGKELLYGATLEAPLAATLLTAVAMSTNMLLVAAAGMVGIVPFFGKKPDVAGHVHEPAPSMWFGPALLAGLGIAIGLLPNLLGTIWVSPAASAVTGKAIAVKLALMHGFTFQLFLSVVTFCGGAALFIWRHRLLEVVPELSFFKQWTPSSLYERTVSGVLTLARMQTRFLQNGHLHLYVLTIIVTTVCLTGAFLWPIIKTPISIEWHRIHIYEYAVVLVIISATILVIRAPSRLFAIIALGVLGYTVVLFYVLYGAPDLAMTQFAIDTLTVIFLVLVIYRLPRYIQYSTPLERLRDAAPAAAAGGLMTLLILFTMAQHSGSQISAYFTENAYHLAKGHNVVNVILVDFRALDTMGEITVLVVAGIGIFSMLKLAKSHGKNTPDIKEA